MAATHYTCFAAAALAATERVQFKLATLVHRSLARTAAVYLSDEIIPNTASGARSLRSNDTWTCTVRCTYDQFDDRCFAAAGPSLWNILPQPLRHPDTSSDRFKRLLKAFLYDD
jgi:hypothetical protein